MRSKDIMWWCVGGTTERESGKSSMMEAEMRAISAVGTSSTPPVAQAGATDRKLPSSIWDKRCADPLAVDTFTVEGSSGGAGKSCAAGSGGGGDLHRGALL